MTSLLTPEQVAALRALLATVDSSGTEGQAASVVPTISDSSIGADGGALEKENPMCRIDGPFKNRSRWRVRVVDRDTGKSKSHIYATEDEAMKAIPRLRREYKRPVGVTVAKALEAYEEYLQAKGNRVRSIAVTLGRLGGVFEGARDLVTGELRPVRMHALWLAYAEGKAVDTKANTLNQLRTFMTWISAKGWLTTTDLLDGIEVMRRRRKGKPQLTEDESRRFLTVALEQGGAGDSGAVAAATALLLGMRASEIADRIVRDLDGGGTKLNITSAKTEAGVRRLRLPAVLQPLFQNLAQGKQPVDRLFGDVNRHWVLRAVHRICKTAGVPTVPTHGLRGTHAKLAVEAGISGDVVAASLGHESFAITAAHYAGHDAVASAAADRVVGVLQ